MRERWDREDTAPRLHDEVPSLKRLEVVFVERTGPTPLGATRHIRHVQVDHAAAHFEIPCNDGDCELGGHDLTGSIMRGLKEMKRDFTGEHSCRGSNRTGSCERVLEFTVHAEYEARPRTASAKK
jgi:hypothetical protein